MNAIILKKRASLKQAEHSRAIQTKDVWYFSAYNDRRLKGMLKEGVRQSVWQNTQSYWYRTRCLGKGHLHDTPVSSLIHSLETAHWSWEDHQVWYRQTCDSVMLALLWLLNQFQVIFFITWVNQRSQVRQHLLTCLDRFVAESDHSSTDLTLNAAMDLVISCNVCLDKTYLTFKCPIISASVTFLYMTNRDSHYQVIAEAGNRHFKTCWYASPTSGCPVADKKLRNPLERMGLQSYTT